MIKIEKTALFLVLAAGSIGQPLHAVEGGHQKVGQNMIDHSAKKHVQINHKKSTEEIDNTFLLAINENNVNLVKKILSTYPSISGEGFVRGLNACKESKSKIKSLLLNRNESSFIDVLAKSNSIELFKILLDKDSHDIMKHCMQKVFTNKNISSDQLKVLLTELRGFIDKKEFIKTIEFYLDSEVSDSFMRYTPVDKMKKFRPTIKFYLDSEVRRSTALFLTFGETINIYHTYKHYKSNFSKEKLKVLFDESAYYMNSEELGMIFKRSFLKEESEEQIKNLFHYEETYLNQFIDQNIIQRKIEKTLNFIDDSIQSSCALSTIVSHYDILNQEVVDSIKRLWNKNYQEILSSDQDVYDAIFKKLVTDVSGNGYSGVVKMLKNYQDNKSIAPSKNLITTFINSILEDLDLTTSALSTGVNEEKTENPIGLYEDMRFKLSPLFLDRLQNEQPDLIVSIKNQYLKEIVSNVYFSEKMQSKKQDINTEPKNQDPINLKSSLEIKIEEIVKKVEESKLEKSRNICQINAPQIDWYDVD